MRKPPKPSRMRVQHQEPVKPSWGKCARCPAEGNLRPVGRNSDLVCPTCYERHMGMAARKLLHAVFPRLYSDPTDKDDIQ